MMYKIIKIIHNNNKYNKIYIKLIKIVIIHR